MSDLLLLFLARSRSIGGALIMALAVGLTRLDYDALLRFMWSTF